jgi:hypothetical protein
VANETKSDERSYRRGLILGLTMAEVVMLLFFALLLTWAIGIRKQQEDATRIDALNNRVAELQDEVKQLAGSRQAANQFDDLFRELKASEQQAAGLRKTAEILTELGREAGLQDGPPEAIAERIREQVEIARQVTDLAKNSQSSNSGLNPQQVLQRVASLTELQQALQRAGLTPGNVAEVTHSAEVLRELGNEAGLSDASAEQIAAGLLKDVDIARRVTDAVRQSGRSPSPTEAGLAAQVAGLLSLESELQKTGLDASKIPVFVAQVQDQLREKENALRSLQGRLKYTESQLQTLGRGTEKPACWADPETGKPEYIFDVALQSTSLLVRDNALPQRRDDEAKLPIQQIRFGENTSLQQFRDETNPLFLWSEKEGCRFFVRVFDLTAPQEKYRYKLHLRTVGERFYYYEKLTRSW